MDTNERKAVLDACDRTLFGHGRPRPHDELLALAEWVDPAAHGDSYGTGEVIESFERDVAKLLGKEAAIFMPSGTMAQQIALRIWCDRAGVHRVAFHPTCHLELHEQNAYREIHHLEAALVGPPDRLMTIEDFEAAPRPLAALLVELPQREIGGQLPEWDDLVALVERARAEGLRLHLDGARLWECGPFYGRSYAEIAALFDTVYVSFYKGLGGIAGAVLAGPADLVAESRVWERRHGGNLVRLYPYVLSARKGLEERLPKMGRYVEAARAIAAALAAVPEVEVTPNPPPTNMMHVRLPYAPERVAAAALEVSRETRVWVTHGVRPTADPAASVLELSVGDATLEVGPDEVASLYARIVQRLN